MVLNNLQSGTDLLEKSYQVKCQSEQEYQLFLAVEISFDQI